MGSEVIGTIGHVRAAGEEVFVRDHGRVFALDEQSFVALVGADRDERRTALVAAMIASWIEGEAGAVERLWRLQDSAGVVSTTDRRMHRLLKMFMVLNTCVRDGCVAPDEAHDPLNKDVVLKERYRVLRATG